MPNHSMSKCVGLRVVRGPNWKWQMQDGGEGNLGTVVSVNSSSANSPTAVVRWDCGTQATYRTGGESAYDLRIIDNATCGVRHESTTCDACHENGIAGIRWKCMVCNDYDLCTSCYMNDKHDVDHKFKRIVEPASNPVEMPPRRSSLKLDAKGIFPSAVVIRGVDWKWADQDGGSGKTGKVVEISSWSQGSYRSAVRVLWDETGRQDLYRLGHDGKVDIQGKTCGPGGKYYRDHLPNVGETQIKPPLTVASPASRPFAVGDRVRTAVPLDRLTKMQEGHGGWIPEMNDIVGKAGVVVGFTEPGNVRVEFDSKKTYIINPGALSKAPKFAVNDTVKMIGDATKAKSLQEGHGGWNDKMHQVLGQIGKVIEVTANGDLRVNFKDSKWVLNPNCCTEPSNADLDCVATASTTDTPSAKEASELLIGLLSALATELSEATTFKEDDIVTIVNDVNKVKALQRGHGGWNDDMKTAMGKTGKVLKVDSDGDLIVRVNGSRWIFNPACCTMATESERASMKDDGDEETDIAEVLARTLVGAASAASMQVRIGLVTSSVVRRKPSAFKSNDIVTVISDVTQAKRLQEGHGGWNDLMLFALGKTGRVVMVDSDGDVKVDVGGGTWTFNPESLTLVKRDGPASKEDCLIC